MPIAASSTTAAPRSFRPSHLLASNYQNRNRRSAAAATAAAAVGATAPWNAAAGGAMSDTDGASGAANGPDVDEVWCGECFPAKASLFARHHPKTSRSLHADASRSVPITPPVSSAYASSFIALRRAREGRAVGSQGAPPPPAVQPLVREPPRRLGEVLEATQPASSADLINRRGAKRCLVSDDGGGCNDESRSPASILACLRQQQQRQQQQQRRRAGGGYAGAHGAATVQLLPTGVQRALLKCRSTSSRSGSGSYEFPIAPATPASHEAAENLGRLELHEAEFQARKLLRQALAEIAVTLEAAAEARRLRERREDALRAEWTTQHHAAQRAAMSSKEAASRADLAGAEEAARCAHRDASERSHRALAARSEASAPGSSPSAPRAPAAPPQHDTSLTGISPIRQSPQEAQQLAGDNSPSASATVTCARKTHQLHHELAQFHAWQATAPSGTRQRTYAQHDDLRPLDEVLGEFGRWLTAPTMTPNGTISSVDLLSTWHMYNAGQYRASGAAATAASTTTTATHAPECGDQLSAAAENILHAAVAECIAVACDELLPILLLEGPQD